MTTEPRPDRTHVNRIYKRIDELSARVGRLERAVYIGSGGIGAIAIFNLISNVSQMSGG